MKNREQCSRRSTKSCMLSSIPIAVKVALKTLLPGTIITFACPNHKSLLQEMSLIKILLVFLEIFVSKYIYTLTSIATQSCICLPGVCMVLKRRIWKVCIFKYYDTVPPGMPFLQSFVPERSDLQTNLLFNFWWPIVKQKQTTLKEAPKLVWFSMHQNWSHLFWSSEDYKFAIHENP